ncbi:MAG: RNA methyltransferase [Clostridia bacterium]|nr:RNA methyltransferase [Clostridia bacterium]
MNDQYLQSFLTQPPITSRQNGRVVELVKLSERKHRKVANLFRFDGIKLAKEALLSRLPVRTIFLKNSQSQALLRQLLDGNTTLPSGAEVLCLEDSLFDRVSEENAPEGVICTCEFLPLHTADADVQNIPPFERIVILESVRDPSNLGAIIRSAAALGVDHLVISADCADIYNPKTVRASMGTLFRQSIYRVTDIPATVASLGRAGRRTFAAALDRNALQLGSFAPMCGDCVVIGNEGHGLSDATIAACDRTVYIPMTDRAESLNAAVAASLLMWSFRTEDKKTTRRDEI